MQRCDGQQRGEGGGNGTSGCRCWSIDTHSFSSFVYVRGFFARVRSARCGSNAAADNALVPETFAGSSWNFVSNLRISISRRLSIENGDWMTYSISFLLNLQANTAR